MNAMHAFWSATLYDLDNGFFIPNERKKYSVGGNAGFELDEDGGIRIATVGISARVTSATYPNSSDDGPTALASTSRSLQRFAK